MNYQKIQADRIKQQYYIQEGSLNMFKIKQCFLTTEAHNSPCCIEQHSISDILILDHESAQEQTCSARAKI